MTPMFGAAASLALFVSIVAAFAAWLWLLTGRHRARGPAAAPHAGADGG